MGLTFEVFDTAAIDVDFWQCYQVPESCRFSIRKGNMWNLCQKMIWKKAQRCCLLNSHILSSFRITIRTSAAPLMIVLYLRIGRCLVLLIYNLELSLVDVTRS